MKEPKIRFKGFEGEWETSIIGDIATFSKGRGYSKSDLRSEGNPIVLYGRLYTNYASVIESVDTFASLQNGSVLTKGNEVIIPGSGETPEDIAVASAVEQKGVILGGDLNVLSFDQDKIVPTFAAMSITNSKTHYELSGYAQGKTIVHLHNSSISKGHISYPYIEEQRAIASYFQHLDSLIQSTTKKIESLKQVKAASLQSMFPQEGETTPRVRFKGFEGEWETDSIENIAIIIKGEQINKSELSNYGTYYVLNGGVSPSGYTEKFNTKSNTISISEGGNSCGYVSYNNQDFWSGGHNYTLQNVRINNNFLFAYLKSKEYEIMSKRVGSGLPNIQKKSLQVFLVHFPLDGNEQRAIASYFTNLDRQITLQNQRLEKLKQIKAACLDKMFV